MKNLGKKLESFFADVSDDRVRRITGFVVTNNSLWRQFQKARPFYNEEKSIFTYKTV